MNSEIMIKLKESLASVLPIVVIVLILGIFVVPISGLNIGIFLFSAILVVIGLALFTLGADISMMDIGERVGTHLVKTKKVWLITFMCFLIGVIVTVAEPDLQVLADQVPMIETNLLKYSVAFGVGLFLVIAALRVLFQVKLSKLLLIFYVLTFGLAYFVPSEFLGVAFDSGGVTTGAMTVPFIMSLGVGLSMLRKDATSESDTFGFVALASIGPIITVLILGLGCDASQIDPGTVDVISYTTLLEAMKTFFINLPEYFREVATSLVPLLVFFAFYDMAALRLESKKFVKICFGLMYTFFGLVIFLSAVNFGFMPVASMLGESLGAGKFSWLIVPIGALIGYFIVSAEPAVMVLKKQVEDVTEGEINGKVLGVCLGIGVALSVALALVRILTGLSIWWYLIPGYFFALLMMKFVPSIFTAISFDSGGVASGPLTATFLLPFAKGICNVTEGSNILDAFGIVAMVAMTPLITIQALGVIYSMKLRWQEQCRKRFEKLAVDGNEIVDFDL